MSGAGLVISTTSQIEDRPVLEYLGIVSGEAVMSTALTTEREPGARRQLRSAATALEQRVRDTRCQAIKTMVQQANELGATAIIAVNITYTTVQRPMNEELLIVTASGTVVVL
ncbi:MAG TPA: heavy metal-binding domain-containing protein [Thermomicrobiales bacterium]|nr:heavy metal-binding domain-containing protein [Thermomicrobiales bacterium]